MSSSQLGEDISAAVTDISPDGIWVLLAGDEYFMPFEDFPWFRQATVEQILNAVEEVPGSYHWPDLDVDLGLKTIQDPKRFPLIAS